MSGVSTSGREIERSVYTVGGLAVGLLGVEQLATTVVSVYAGTYNLGGRSLEISPPTWAGWVSGIIVGTLFLLSGAYLWVRGRRVAST